METPPNTKIFDTAFTGNATDTATLARRRAVVQQPLAPAVNFEGLVDVLKHLNPTLQQPLPTQIPLASVPHNFPPPKMSTHEFCIKFELSPVIQAKLSGINVTGPHLLRLIDNAALRTEGGLDLGELAGVRDAEERWMTEVAQLR